MKPQAPASTFPIFALGCQGVLPFTKPTHHFADLARLRAPSQRRNSEKIFEVPRPHSVRCYSARSLDPSLRRMSSKDGLIASASVVVSERFSAVGRPRCCRHESLQVLCGRTFELPGPHSGMLRAHFWISIAHRVRCGERYLGCRRNDCRYLSETPRCRTPCARPARDVCPPHPHFRFAMTLTSKAAMLGMRCGASGTLYSFDEECMPSSHSASRQRL